MPKLFYEYIDDTGKTFAFRQDSVIGGALGNTVAGANVPRLPDKLKPRRVSIAHTGGYQRPVVGIYANYLALTPGAALLAGVVCGKDGEVNNGFSR